FYFSEMMSHHVAQTGLELLALSNPPSWASQRAEITDMSHHTPPMFYILQNIYLLIHPDKFTNFYNVYHLF
uniref:Uncharacterized protein n=1 Tax=Macaca fascicularis TaxID=9541 RepID=A0A7N9CZM5_MACFA